MTQSGGSYNKEPPLFLCGKQICLDIFENHEYNNNRTENKKHETVNGGQYGNII